MSGEHLTIVKQLAAKLTSFGFANNPRGCVVTHEGNLSSSVSVYAVTNIVDMGGGNDTVWALVVFKGHVPLPAYHVVDFRIGSNIYGTGVAPDPSAVPR